MCKRKVGDFQMNLIAMSRIPLTRVERNELQRLLKTMNHIPTENEDLQVQALVQSFRENQSMTGITDARIFEISEKIGPYLDLKEKIMMKKILSFLRYK